MDASGHTYMMKSDEQLRNKSMNGQGGWEAQVGSMDAAASSSSSATSFVRRNSWVGDHGNPVTESDHAARSGSFDHKEKEKKTRKSFKSRNSVVFKQEEHERTKETLKIAFEINKNKGLKKALNYLMACNFLTDSPRDVSNFLRMYQTSLDDALLGDYLGEGGVGSKEEEYWNLVRYHYVRAVSFEGLDVEQGLRHYLTSCGFRLPGESQKIDRLMSTFAHCFWEDNSGDSDCCPFSHQDTIYLLAFAIIMLNTDLHKMSVDTKRSSRRKMNKAEFMKNLRGVDTSISPQYLSDIYDKIESHPIEMYFDKPQGVVESAGDDIASTGVSFKDLQKGVKGAGELLRGLALFDQNFSTVGLDTMLSSDLVRFTFLATWHHFHGIIAATLDAAQNDLQPVLSCLDVLKYALSAAIFLEMKRERTAFASQLSRVRKIKSGGEPNPDSASEKTEFEADEVFAMFKSEEWYVEMELACDRGEAEVAVQQVHMLIIDLRASMHDSKKRRELKAVACRIQGGSGLLDDANREFIRESDLVKKCRYFRKVRYRFFLFNDRLVYTHQSQNGMYVIHAELMLSLMRISDVESKKGLKFEIKHPQKTFIVSAPNIDLKHAWVEAISAGIDMQVEKKLRMEEVRQHYAEGMVENHGDEGGIRDGGSSITSDWSEISVLTQGIEIDVNGLGRLSTNGNIENGDDEKKTIMAGSSATSPVGATAGDGAAAGENKEEDVNALFHRALLFSTDLLSDSGDKGHAEGVKLDLYSLFKQAKEGDCSDEGEEDSSTGKAAGEINDLKLQAWKSRRGISQLDAKIMYIDLLNVIAPGWENRAAR
jgi:acyl-CoA-binding protein